jgi:hypothetical protein
MKKIILLLLVISLQNIAAQNAKTITIKGRTPNINGTVKLLPFFLDNAYYAGLKFEESAKITDGEFSFTIKCSDNNPYPVRFVINDTISTNRFYLCHEDMDVKIEALVHMTIPNVSVKCTSLDLDRPKFRAGIDKIDKDLRRKTDSVYAFKGNNLTDADLNYLSIDEDFWKAANNNLKTFITENRSSQLGFWQLATYLNSRGYNETYEQSYNEFDNSIKNSIAGKALLINQTKAKVLKS